MWFRPAVRDSLPAISCPTVVIHGRDDRSWPVKHAYETALGIPGARLVLLDNAGHFPTMDSPAETTAAMRDWILS
jgi:pimeloyl-ACP methyl ester carboxylesterase